MSAPFQSDLQDLYSRLLDDDSKAVFSELLSPWCQAQQEFCDWLRNFGQRPGQPFPPASTEERQWLYALSRINDTLLLRFQRLREDSQEPDSQDWAGPELSRGEYERFLEALGMTFPWASDFSPFYHEIVEVIPAKSETAPIVLQDICWPAAMAGPLLFSRAGVVVTAGSQILDKMVAETSPLYWSYRRRNRPTCDLSQGWGHNSQWRTLFRRDYAWPEGFAYNVDGACDLAGSVTDAHPDQIPLARRIELLTYRCWIHAPVLEEPWPFDDCYIERR